MNSDTIIISILLAFVGLSLLLSLFVLFKNHRHKKIPPALQNKVQKHWQKILIESKSHHKQAVLEADKLLDFALYKKGFQGNLGTKLKKASFHFSNYQKLWEAHKLRNKLAHEIDFEISESQSKFALENFRTALKDLGFKI